MHSKLQNLVARFRGPSRDQVNNTITSHTTSFPTASTLFLHFSIQEQVLFAKRLSFLVKAGVSILESMTMIHAQTKSKRKRIIFYTIIQDVSAGQFLSTSLARYEHLFGEFTINIIRIGENNGILSENLIYLADELAKKQALKRKVQSALVYPVFITIATLGVTSLLVMFIFPKIMPIFISLNIALPLTTRILLAISVYLETWGLVTFFGLIGAVLVFIISRNVFPRLRTISDWILLRLPIIGNIARAYNCANFCRTVGLNISAGVGVVEAMRITARVTKNTIYKNAYLDIAEHIEKGEKISTRMMHYLSIFPDMLPHMLLIGETTGSLSVTLSYLSSLYETEVDESTKSLSNSIEPILLMTMGILVGLIAVSVITPIYEVTKHLSN
ncbi:type II secretion system F family protein [Candidatus Kaiserbacteria bacterium]|nr:MAG: type II secretion system F family protein [Candidatus Kaiserbacteria bacterium]